MKIGPAHRSRSDQIKRSGAITTVLLFHLSWEVVIGTQFVSHVRVTTPAHSYAHGVGDPLPVRERSLHSRRPPIRDLRTSQATQAQYGGYPRLKPLIPFNAEEPRAKISPWQHALDNAETIPVLPPSPYKVDSPDPESLWPVGLFLPPLKPPSFDINRRSSTGDYLNPGLNGEETNYNDPYFLQGSEALAAVEKARLHGKLYFHDIPHITSLLANQELRIKNNLKPNRIGSIRQSWPYNRV
ncbi:uncharacterized protein LOC123692033 isoform X1 [Colias croceus]|uniref:uncharacterized protein LOC123692033 isoform X1 n=1 Tax=Colias crocea TaxID=72248 RepID=UPI001E27ADA2|nr:uncharacterized protein LOC123692033 isoform X1 [Colias croceus]